MALCCDRVVEEHVWFVTPLSGEAAGNAALSRLGEKRKEERKGGSGRVH